MTSSTRYAASIDDIREAAERIKPHARLTPVFTCSTLNKMAGKQLLFKCENFQKVGAFKFRGACNAVLKLTDEACGEVIPGVVTHSSGNHAQALARAASLREIPAHIVMPANAPTIKKQAVEGYGGIIHECPPTLQDREETASRVIEETGGIFIHPYNHPDVIAGQGTCAFEFLENGPPLDALIAPVGGGGLMSGTCLAARAISPKTRLFAAEPSGADDAARSLAAGELIPQTDPHTIADGLLTSLGDLTWPILRDHLEAVITVDDDAIRAALSLIWQRMKIVIEPSSATALAAALDPSFKKHKNLRRIGIILTGGNIEV